MSDGRAEQDGRFSACQADAAPRRFRYFPLGGYGFIKEYPVEKLMRDAKVMQLY